MNRKVQKILLVSTLSTLLSGCSFKEGFKKAKNTIIHSDFEVFSEIWYALDPTVGKDQRMLDTHFEINTRIYVHVDFTIQKRIKDKKAPKENLDFIVQIPYAEYYSTKEYYQGTIIPKENLKYAQDLHGNSYTIMELTEMTFVIDDKEKHPYYYVFEIEANQICENAEFITRFEPDNRNLSISVNDDNKDNSCRGVYSFIEKSEQ